MRPPLFFAALPFAAVAVMACAGATPGFAWPGDAASGPFRVEVTDPSGSPLRTFDEGGRTYVLGEEGQRYRIRVRNGSGRRIEAVVSVDGRDALDGQPARSDKPGYVVPAYGEVLIDGFRLSMRDVATFRFAPVADSYAAQMGNARHVGVIGVAVFEERRRDPPPRIRRPDPRPEPRPWYDPRPEPRPTDSEEDRDEASKAPAAPRTAEASPKAGASPSRDPAPEEGRGYAGREKSGGSQGSSASEPRDRRAADRPGLGTTFGERRDSRVVQVEFERRHPSRADALLALRYNDRRGLLALGIELRLPPRWPDNRELRRRETARPFEDLPRTFAAPPRGWEEEQGWDDAP